MPDAVDVKHYGRVQLAGDPLGDRWQLLARVQRRADELAGIREGVIEAQHGPGTRMRVGDGHPDWDRADRHWRKAHAVESAVFGSIVAGRAGLPADKVRELVPVPWLLRGGGCWAERSTRPVDEWGNIHGCIWGSMTAYGAAGGRAKAGKRLAVDLAVERERA